MTPRSRLELYRLVVILAAGAAGLAVLPAGGRLDWPLAIGLAGLGVLALQFPLEVGLRNKVSVSTSVFFAMALLFTAPQAALLTAAAQATSSVISVTRRVRAERRRPPLRVVTATVAFNAAQFFLAVLLAGLLLAAGRVSAANGIPGPVGVGALVAAALTMYSVNLLLVSTAEGLGSRRNPLRVFMGTQRAISVRFAGLYLTGLLVALATVRVPWAALLVALPGVLTHLALRRSVRLSRDTIAALETLAEDVDRRDPYTYQHSRRVAEYSVALGRRLGLKPDQLEMLRLAARVHDLGKLAIPDDILLKPGRLTAEERRRMEAHPRNGYDMLAKFVEYAKVRELVLTHHERFDGGGYPNGIVGARLPLIGQVMPVADSLDAMTSARPYRGAMAWEDALAQLALGAGSQWNPRVVAAALAMKDEATPAPAPPPAAAPSSPAQPPAVLAAT